MDADLLQSLSAITMTGGLFFTGLGGAGYYYFGRAVRTNLESERALAESKLRANIDTLRRTNEELLKRIGCVEKTATAETPEPAALAEVSAPAFEPAPVQARPAPPSVKAPPLKSAETAVWEGASIFEELIGLAEEPKNESILNEKHRREMVKILRNHAGGNILIQSVKGKADSMELAQSLRSTFLEAGWNVGDVEEVEYAEPPSGLSVSTAFPAPEDAVTACGALAAAGVHFVQRRDSKLTGDRTTIVVGMDARRAL